MQGTRAYDEALFEARATRGVASAPRPDVAALPSEGDVVGGQYRLVRRLGAGTFGKVYLAERLDVPAHRVALKLVAREVYRGRDVARELVMLAAASHPHVVALKDHGATDAYVWLTMPVYDGETLADRLGRGPLGLEEAHAVFAPIAQALAALHEAGLRHQDVKPDNVFLARFAGRLHPVLLDLGVAAPKDARFVAGTLLYAAPEQIRALEGDPGAPIDERIDTYGFAATLLAAIVPPALFPGEDAATRGDVRLAHAARATRPIADGAIAEAIGAPREAIARAIARWLAIDPRDRPTMAEVAGDLEVLTGPARDRARREAARRDRGRRAARAAAVAAATALLAGLGVAWGHRDTLRLARDLERARAEGAAHFDRLDSCVAAHRVSEREVAACGASRARERAAHEAALAEIGRGAGDEAGRARALAATVASRLRACEDDGDRMATAYARDRQRLAGEADEARAAREADRAEAAALRDRAAAEARRAIEEAERARDAEKKTAADRAAALAEAERDLAAARAEVAACAEQRAAANAAAATPAKPAAPRPATPPRGPTASRAAPAEPREPADD